MDILPKGAVSLVTGKPFVRIEPKHIPEPPKEYTEELGERICELVMEGEHSLIAITKIPGMPTRVQLMRWLDKYPEFAAKYYRAKNMQAEVLDARIQDTADACTEETTHSSMVKIKAYQWRASRIAPKRYGEKVEIGGDKDNPLMMTVNAARQLDDKIGRLIKRGTDEGTE